MQVGWDAPYGTECLTCDQPILVLECFDCGAPIYRQHRHVCNRCAHFLLMRSGRARGYTVREYV